MGCVVEVTVTEDELVGRMNHMRAWLDHRRFEPSSFTLSEADGRSRARAVQERQRGGGVRGGVRGPAALLGRLRARGRLSGAEWLHWIVSATPFASCDWQQASYAASPSGFPRSPMSCNRWRASSKPKRTI